MTATFENLVFAVPAWIAGLLLTALSVRQDKMQRVSWPEAVVGGTFALTGALIFSFALPAALFAAAAGAASVSAAVDIKHQLLPDMGSAIIAFCGAAHAVTLAEMGDRIISVILASLILVVAMTIVTLRRRQAALGSGDVLLAAASACWAPPRLVPIALLIAVGLTIVLALPAYLKDHNFPPRLAFGPGLLAGFGICALSSAAGLGARFA